MQNISGLIKYPYVKEIIEHKNLTTFKDVLMFLETYKYNSRSEIVEFLNTCGHECEELSEFVSDARFSQLERTYGVLVVELDEHSVVIYHDVTENPNKEGIELAVELNMKTVVFKGITPLNYRQVYLRTQASKNPLDIFQRILVEALHQNATDIHFEVRHEKDSVRYPVLFRINGDLQEVNVFTLTAEENKAIISALVERKTDANSLDLLNYEGVTTSAFGLVDDTLSLRISANSVYGGYHYVIRIQELKTISFTIDKLGFSEPVITAIHRLVKKRSGVTFITGAIRTGKNTTAFAMANEMAKQPIKIVSYESPIEVLMPFSQKSYQDNPDVLLAAIRLAKKQDVNVAFINELPNKEVAFAVRDLVNSSVHVITTMHMNRVWHLPYKLKEYYGDSFKDLLSQINVVINQKMYVKACPHCQSKILSASIEDERIRNFLLKRDVVSIPKSMGCPQCNGTGYVLGSNQPYAEFIEFTEDLTEELQSCSTPAEMEVTLKKAAKDTSLEVFMLEGITRGVLSYGALFDIV